MADVQEDVTLQAHIRAEDEGASDVFGEILGSVKGFGGALLGVGEGAAEMFTNISAAAGIFGGVAAGVFKETVDSATHYGEAVAKVAFLTHESTQASSGLISAYRAQGFTTDEATMSIQRLTMRLGGIDQQFRSTHKLSKANTEQLKELGLTTEDLVKHGGNLSAQLPKIIEHLKNMKDPLERDRLSMQLFGRNFGSIAPLIDAGGAAFLRAEGDAKKFGVSLGPDQVHALEAYKSGIETTKEAIQGITLQIGFYALPAFQKMEDLIKQGIAWWEKLSPGVHKSALEILKLTAVFGTLFGGASALSGVIKPMLHDVPILGGAFESLIGPIIPFLGIIGPLVGLFIILQHLFLTNAQAAQILTPVIGMAKLVFEEFMNLLDIARDVMMQVFNDALPKGQSAFQNIAKTVAGFVTGALAQLGIWFSDATIWIADHRIAIGLWADKLAAFAGDVAKFLSDTLRPLLDAIGGIKDFILNQLIPALSQVAWPTADPAVMAAWGWLKDNGATVGNAIKYIAIGYAAIKTVGAINGVVTSVYDFALAFQAVQVQEGTAIALQRVLGIEGVINAAKSAAAWVASAFTTNTAIATGATESEAMYAAMGMESETAAGKSGLAWVGAGLKSAASAVRAAAVWVAQGAVAAGAAVGSAARAAAAWVASSATSLAGAVAAGAGAAAAWVASSAVAVASAVAAAAGWLLANGAMLVVKGATLAWTAAQWLLDAALAANPIGLIIVAIALLVAGIIWAYNNVGFFRTGVNQLWAILQVLGAWITGTLMPAMGRFFSWLGTTANNIARGVGTAFSGLGTTVNNVWSGIMTGIRGYINQIIDAINIFIGGINRMGSAIKAIPGVPQFGAIPTIPRLAQGGIFGPGYGGPSLAVVGEGKEAEIVAKMSSIFKAGMASAGGTGGGMGGNITIEYHVDGQLIERRTSKITGKRMRLQGGGIGSAA
jgi:hypothetical protein